MCIRDSMYRLLRLFPSAPTAVSSTIPISSVNSQHVSAIMRTLLSAPWASPQAAITNGSFTLTHTISSAPAPTSSSCSCTNPGRCDLDHPGVNAPGSPNKMPRLPSNRAERSTLLAGEASKQATEGSLDPMSDSAATVESGWLRRRRLHNPTMALPARANIATQITPPYSALIPVSYTHLTLPTKRIV
eukprot:TRINITY_DN1785_c0_g1_i2.p2 TRINITY_DN1785_c0_g1~~TRINITY_DN1785_c0_g1_i2.p2  ORF type:complete len:188 (-),score=16.50 TRINITY_DN1785_c0_g1_i2:89-652(-)